MFLDFILPDEDNKKWLWRACMLFSFGRVFYNNYLLEQMAYEKDFSLSLVLPVSFCLQKSGGR